MTHTTEKTIRTQGQWLKITRDSKNKTFTFARGYENDLQATEVQTYSFKWIQNWTDAKEHATRTLATYA